MVRKSAIVSTFPDWRLLKKHPDIRAMMVYDEGRLTVKRLLKAEAPAERIYCFTLPAPTADSPP